MNSVEENTAWMQETAGSWMEQFNKPDIANSILLWLIEHYCESHRGYHTLQHLRLMYEELAPHLNSCEQQNAVVAALFWHDCIYQPQKSNNEEKSAQFAKEHLLQLEASSSLIDSTEKLILATANHTIAKGTPDQNLFLDADLSILGQTEERYAWYAEGVRKEYSYVPKLIYSKGRKKVLSTFLQTDNIYRTPQFYAVYEDKARDNIAKEIKTL